MEKRLQKFQIQPDEWILIQRLKDILDIFVQATEHLSGSNYPTLSAQLPSFSVLAPRMESVVDQECSANSIFYHACSASWHKLDEYHSKTGSVQAISTILDPRYKIQTFRNLGWRTEWIADAEASIRRVYKDQYASMIVSTLLPISTTPTVAPNDFMTAVFGNTYITRNSVVSEIDIYLEERVELPHVDPIEWWRMHEARFPNLSCMARDYLAISATSVPSERCFSIASSLLTKQRGRMAEGMANAIMCCKYWLGFEEYTTQELLLEQAFFFFFFFF